uniref:Uncharacterized protein n=1 Tax=viral metagenome TaxID=1070528 RepID=A0A6C0H5A5_9ZZZZ
MMENLFQEFHHLYIGIYWLSYVIKKNEIFFIKKTNKK